jgi:hypothetical protein
MGKNRCAGKDANYANSSKKKTSSLAFVGGLIFASVVAGVILTKNKGIRAEVEAQAKSLLNTSSEFIRKLRFTDSLFAKLTGDSKTANYNSTIGVILPSGDTPVLSDAYDSLWQEAEQQNAEYGLGRSGQLA